MLRAKAAATDASGGDVSDAVVMIAVMSANVRHLDEARTGLPRHIHYEDPPADTIRRPVTALAVAERVRLPRETVRRRLERLTTAGRCQRTAGGYIVPQDVIANEEHLEAARANLRAAARLRRDIDSTCAEVLPPMTPTSRLGSYASPPLRLISRRLAEFSLDVTAPLAELAGGYDEAFVYLAAVEATGRCQRPLETPYISAYSLAYSLKLPEESARRRLKKLVARGLLGQGPRGYSAEPAASRMAEVAALARTNHRALCTLFERLSEDGVNLATPAA